MLEQLLVQLFQLAAYFIIILLLKDRRNPLQVKQILVYLLQRLRGISIHIRLSHQRGLLRGDVEAHVLHELLHPRVNR